MTKRWALSVPIKPAHAAAEPAVVYFVKAFRLWLRAMGGSAPWKQVESFLMRYHAKHGFYLRGRAEGCARLLLLFLRKSRELRGTTMVLAEVDLPSPQYGTIKEYKRRHRAGLQPCQSEFEFRFSRSLRMFNFPTASVSWTSAHVDAIESERPVSMLYAHEVHERRRAAAKVNSAKTHAALSDAYVRAAMRRAVLASKERMPDMLISEEVVLMKREQLLLRRLAKHLQQVATEAKEQQ